MNTQMQEIVTKMALAISAVTEATAGLIEQSTIPDAARKAKALREVVENYLTMPD